MPTAIQPLSILTTPQLPDELKGKIYHYEAGGSATRFDAIEKNNDAVSTMIRLSNKEAKRTGNPDLRVLKLNTKSWDNSWTNLLVIGEDTFKKLQHSEHDTLNKLIDVAPDICDNNEFNKLLNLYKARYIESNKGAFTKLFNLAKQFIKK